jgi:hypothetical protein
MRLFMHKANEQLIRTEFPEQYKLFTFPFSNIGELLSGHDTFAYTGTGNNMYNLYFCLPYARNAMNYIWAVKI